MAEDRRIDHDTEAGHDDAPKWIAERDRTNAVSHEAASYRQPTPVAGSPLADRDPGPPEFELPSSRGGSTPSAAQLRDRIQSGETHDKIAFPDPAAAPLGTDAEAGGHRPTAAEIEIALQAEAAPTTAKGDVDATTTGENDQARGFAIWLGLVTAILLAAGGAALYLR